MVSIVQNKDRCNHEFRYVVRIKMKKLISQGYIIQSVRFKANKLNRYTGAIIRYIPRSNKGENTDEGN